VVATWSPEGGDEKWLSREHLEPFKVEIPFFLGFLDSSDEIFGEFFYLSPPPVG